LPKNVFCPQTVKPGCGPASELILHHLLCCGLFGQETYDCDCKLFRLCAHRFLNQFQIFNTPVFEINLIEKEVASFYSSANIRQTRSILVNMNRFESNTAFFITKQKIHALSHSEPFESFFLSVAWFY